MKRNTYEYSKSSLLGITKDAALIMDKIISNQRVLKLITYGVRNWESQPDVTTDMIEEMFKTKQISSVPKIKIDKEEKTYLRLTYGTITPNDSNPQYKDNIFGIDIICHYDNWDLGNFEERPYTIAGELDAELNGCRLTGIGVLNLIAISPYIYNEEYAGVTLTYLAIRGNEDTKNPLS